MDIEGDQGSSVEHRPSARQCRAHYAVGRSPQIEIVSIPIHEHVPCTRARLGRKVGRAWICTAADIEAIQDPLARSVVIGDRVAIIPRRGDVQALARKRDVRTPTVPSSRYGITIARSIPGPST